MLGYAGPLYHICYDNVVIATYEIPHCSSGHKSAAVNKQVGELQQPPAPEAAWKSLLWGGSNQQLQHCCTPKGVWARRCGLPASLDDNIFKNFLNIWLKYKQNTFHLKRTHFLCHHAKKWSPVPSSSSPLLTPWLLQSLLRDLNFWKTTTLTSFTLAFKANI